MLRHSVSHQSSACSHAACRLRRDVAGVGGLYLYSIIKRFRQVPWRVCPVGLDTSRRRTGAGSARKSFSAPMGLPVRGTATTRELATRFGRIPGRGCGFLPDESRRTSRLSAPEPCAFCRPILNRWARPGHCGSPRPRSRQKANITYWRRRRAFASPFLIGGRRRKGAGARPFRGSQTGHAAGQSDGFGGCSKVRPECLVRPWFDRGRSIAEKGGLAGRGRACGSALRDNRARSPDARRRRVYMIEDWASLA